MGMFGKSRVQAQEPYVPNPDPVFGELNPALTAPMPKKRGLFGGGLGKALGTVADVMMYGPFVGQARENRDWRRQQQQAEIEKQHAAAEKARREATQPTYKTVQGVGLVEIPVDGSGPRVSVAAQDDPAAAPAGVREWEYMQMLPPELREQFQRFRQPVPYQYTQPGIEAVVEQTRRTQPFRGGAGGGLPAAKVAALRAEAAEAIAKGADPAAVNAQLQQMLGGQ